MNPQCIAIDRKFESAGSLDMSPLWNVVMFVADNRKMNPLCIAVVRKGLSVGVT